ncbi:hypothetical protein Y032_0004g1742 [Ancylostoma ceylanicum]|nr:hypothetical protein Y032_0004g1742 [Ancylostoma ceylanicum]
MCVHRYRPPVEWTVENVMSSWTWNLPTFIVVFGLGSKCTRPLKFVPNCFVDSNSIAREWLGHEMLPSYAEGNAQQSGSPVLAQVTWYWRHVPQSYGLKFDDVDAVLKALLQAITRRPVQYLEEMQRDSLPLHDDTIPPLNCIVIGRYEGFWLKSAIIIRLARKKRKHEKVEKAGS